jgi:hypothetical protein
MALKKLRKQRLSVETPIRMTSYQRRMNKVGILPKFGTGYLTIENRQKFKHMKY